MKFSRFPSENFYFKSRDKKKKRRCQSSPAPEVPPPPRPARTHRPPQSHVVRPPGPASGLQGTTSGIRNLFTTARVEKKMYWTGSATVDGQLRPARKSRPTAPSTTSPDAVDSRGGPGRRRFRCLRSHFRYPRPFSCI